MGTYSATLNRKHLPDFFALFYELESARGAEVKISPDEMETHLDNYRVEITAKDDTWLGILISTMNEGMLHHQGWGKVFSLTLPHEQPSQKH